MIAVWEPVSRSKFKGQSHKVNVSLIACVCHRGIQIQMNGKLRFGTVEASRSQYWGLWSLAGRGKCDPVTPPTAGLRLAPRDFKQLTRNGAFQCVLGPKCTLLDVVNPDFISVRCNKMDLMCCRGLYWRSETDNLELAHLKLSNQLTARLVW